MAGPLKLLGNWISPSGWPLPASSWEESAEAGGCGLPFRQLRAQRFFLFADPSNIMTRIVLSCRWGNELAALFGAENYVDYVLIVRVRQCVAPLALGHSNPSVPSAGALG